MKTERPAAVAFPSHDPVTAPAQKKAGEEIALTAGQVHDLARANAVAPGMATEALLANKRAIDPLEAAGKNRSDPAEKEPEGRRNK